MKSRSALLLLISVIAVIDCTLGCFGGDTAKATDDAAVKAPNWAEDHDHPIDPDQPNTDAAKRLLDRMQQSQLQSGGGQNYGGGGGGGGHGRMIDQQSDHHPQGWKSDQQKAADERQKAADEAARLKKLSEPEAYDNDGGDYPTATK